MNIVRGNIDCLEDIALLFNGYRMFYEQKSDLEGAKEFIKERILQEESYIFIAYEEDKPVGFVQLFPFFTSVGMKRAYVLNDLFVDPSCRGIGAGKALMQKAFQFCDEMNGRFVLLQTATNNYTAKALYEHVGMELESESDWYIKYFE